MSMFDALGSIKVLSKLMQMGMAAWDAFKEEGISSKEITAIRLATDLLGDLGGKSSGQLSDMAALHFGVITQCFGHALGRQWAFNKQLVPGGLRILMSREQLERAKEIEVRVRLAVSSLPKFGGPSLLQPGDLPASVEGVREAAVIDEPLATPYYRALWEAFSNPKLDEGDEGIIPLLDLEKGRLAFERDFLLAHQQMLASSEGQKLQQYVAGVAGDYRARMLRELLLRDMAEWGERHTFGNVERRDRPADDPIPFMPLAKMYVEPNACLAAKARQEDATGEPVLALIEQWLAASKTNAVVVRADFGMGKSLTARSLAQRLARRFLDMRTPSPEAELPVFIRCAEDLTEEGFDLDAFVRRAWKREAGELDLKLKLDDPVLEPPKRTQRALFILDGLDEVILGERRLESFFQRIKDEASDCHRFIIFSRPGALPAEQGLEGIPVLEILPWAEPQISSWLKAWRGLNGGEGPTPQELESRQLAELARTPILLFMVAQTWKGQSREVGVSRAALYEEFFWQIARGKHEADRKHHKNVYDASAELHRHLMRRGLVTQGTEPPDAMLWLMSRVAWEATKLDQRQMIEPSRKPEVLTKHGITSLLVHELQVDGSASETIEAIQVGLLLTLQAHLRSGAASQLLFGHKSFREFLVARYWADRLKAIACASSRDWEDIEAPLLGGRLLSREDRTFEFLLEMLDGEPHPKRQAAPFSLREPERRSLLEWAQARFESEEPEVPADSARGGRSRQPSLREDRRPWLREAALAIGSALRGSPGLRQRDKLTMRSMLAWFWLMRVGPIVIARKAYLPGASMPDNSLRGADFSEANLEDSNFSRTSLRWRGSSAGEPPTTFDGALLDRALLMNADLSSCSFYGASLRGADLTGALLRSSFLREANLEGAELHGAFADHAFFDSAKLRRAVLMETDFTGASFVGADMTDAYLQGANLTRAVLHDAVLKGAAYDDTTQWPAGFDPVAAGAIHSHE
ncbi:NACHT domain-containing protein [Pyxidicoccus sp. MSG2]|uniref:NACHT domain-containing protein n=1 Tax=Pyxidicoccus sp. MSG2 TaxID=2996790 RepID=UPI00226D687D|nr:pentapeptide repeat-containing protein [Pyxidicoccus sp. MSG2]MCY1018994.1 pentapeptide repeat-containing protein [Pyxidicoccus sp. MSG2]